jgi:flagellar biosynthesis/type III secretory pathway protein FliH
MSRLEAASVLHVTVSGADFADEAALKPLAASAGVKVTADPALPGGRCRMTLRLGNLDVGPADQWPRIAAVLTELGGLEE